MRLGLKNRIFTENDNLEKVLIEKIDYEAFETLRKNERKRTEEYLNRCLQLLK